MLATKERCTSLFCKSGTKGAGRKKTFRALTLLDIQIMACSWLQHYGQRAVFYGGDQGIKLRKRRLNMADRMVLAKREEGLQRLIDDILELEQ